MDTKGTQLIKYSCWNMMNHPDTRTEFMIWKLKYVKNKQNYNIGDVNRRILMTHALSRLQEFIRSMSVCASNHLNNARREVRERLLQTI